MICSSQNNAYICGRITNNNDMEELFIFSYDGNTIEGVKDKSVTHITIPNGVLAIGEKAFSNCESLLSIDIPDSVTYLGSEAFKGCYSLREIDIPHSVESIGYSPFDDTEWFSERSVIYVGSIIYKVRNLFEVFTIPDRIKSIYSNAFEFCNLLKFISIPNSVTNIGAGAFRGCSSLESIIIPDLVNSIDIELFQDCTSLQSITTPKDLKEIEWFAFEGCQSLQKIVIPASVTYIGREIFNGCSSLTELFVCIEKLNELDIDDNVFNESIYENCTLFVPSCVEQEYRHHPVFGKFKKIGIV